MNFGRAENAMLHNLTMDQAYRKAERDLRRSAIDPETFRDLYHSGVDADMAYVKEMEAKFEQAATPETREAQHLATVFEAIIHENAELSDWLGPNAETFKTSRYDDIKNGVDTIVEFQEENAAASHLGLSIDVTFAADTGKKFDRIYNELKRGELPKIKYFRSDAMGFRGELSDAPRVVIGAESKTIKQLAELWLEGQKKELGSHPIQFQILAEILTQLETFESFARKNGNDPIADVLAQRARTVKKILDEKQVVLEDNFDRDSVFYEMERNLARFV